MATTRRCAACSTKLLTSFAAACGTRIRPTSLPTSAARLGGALSTRGFHHAHARLLSSSPQLSNANTHHHSSVDAAAAADGDAQAIPWFLRVETPKAPRHPLAEQQVLPEIPEDAPESLEMVMNTLSKDHGISDLNLLDLRPLNPPPALGNHLMLVGTARSIRHLHATADRMCRYMRSEFKWSPYADGLLGRNELRLINRRKQRRGKVISTQLGQVDETESAGWVCIHGGSEGSIIVQLFTNSKRKEMDIDGLWRGILARDERHRAAEAARQQAREEMWAVEDAQKQQEEAAAAAEEQAAESVEKKSAEPVGEQTAEPVVIEAVEVVEEKAAGPVEKQAAEPVVVEVIEVVQEKAAEPVAEKAAEDVTEKAAEEVQATEPVKEIQPVSQYNTVPSVSGSVVQTRSFHNHTASYSAAAAAAATTSIEITAHPSFPKFSRTGDLSEFLSTLPATAASGPASATAALQAHINTLKSPLVSSTKLLGTGPADHSSTPFLRTFYAALPSAPPAEQVTFELQLQLLGNTYNPRSYPISWILPFLQRLRATGLPVTAEHHYLAATHLASCAELRPEVSATPWLAAANIRTTLLSDFLADLQAHVPASEDVSLRPEFRYARFSALLKTPIASLRAALIAHDATDSLPSQPALVLHPALFRPHTSSIPDDAAAATYGYTLNQHHLDSLAVLGLARKWDAMWELWKQLPLHGVSRGRDAYKLVFELVASAGRQSGAVYAARMAGVEMMRRERPWVGVHGDRALARALVRVLKVAEGGEGGEEWRMQRAVCEKVLESA